jgi:hypothetical protein
MVSAMLVPFNRTAITAAWFVVLGMTALLWSPPSIAMGVFVLLVGLACPAAMLILWKASSPVVARVVARAQGSRHARRSTPASNGAMFSRCSTPGA